MRSFHLRGLFLAVWVFLSQTVAVAAEANPQDAQAVASQQPVTSDSSATQKTTQTDKTDSLKADAVVQPFQVAMVGGDYHKYEAMNWRNRGYSGGLEDFNLNYKSGDDVTVDVDGHAIAGNNDYKGSYQIAKKDVGYIDVDFKQFRKYYDTYGGIYNLLPTITDNSLSRDLFLDIGHIGFEAGITMPDLPNVSVYYDHDYKIGSKSMLNWDIVTQGGTTKKIAPSWEEIDQATDTFGVKADYTEKGYHLTADQRFEIARWKTRGYEQRISDGSATGTAATIATQFDQRRQDQVQETDVMTTTMGVDKWYLNEKVFASSAYRFEHLKNQDRQNIQQFTPSGDLSMVAGVGQLNKPDGSAHNDQDRNSWVMNLMVSPWSWLSGTGGFKAEVVDRKANSYYPTDTSATGMIGVPDYTPKTDTDSNTYKFAESFGLRFKAIPRTAIYSDLSFEQSQNHLFMDRTVIAGDSVIVGTTDGKTENQTRDAVINEPVTTWTVGADFQPLRMINLTSQFRLRDKNMDFDDRFRVKPFNGQVFLETLHTRTLGFNQRVTVRPCSWTQASFRYLFDNTDYTSRAVYDDINEKANVLSNTLVYDLSVYPLSNLSMTGSFTQRQDATKTAQGEGSKVAFQDATKVTQLYPTFTSNYYTWMFSTDYQPHKKLGFNGSLFYTVANNAGNFYAYDQTQFVYYGADYNQTGLSVSCKWDINKDLAVQPQYSFQRYQPNENSGIGGSYDAQIVSLSLVANWG